MIAWREGAQVKVQRFDATGQPVFNSPPSVTMSGTAASPVRLATDGSLGAYLVGASGDGIVARHILQSGREASWDPSVLAGLGLAQPRVDAVTSNTAGDLFAAYSSIDSAGVPGIALLTYAGSWSSISPAPTPAPEWYSGAVPEGSGGAWVLGGGSNSKLWRVAGIADQLTFRPRSLLVTYPGAVTVAGYMTAAGGSPIKDGTVSVGTMIGDTLSVKATTQTHVDGFYSATVKPTANAIWSAEGNAVAERVEIKVAPRVSMALSHLKASRRLSEIFSGSVGPKLAGQTVLVQKAVGKSWKAVAKGKLDSRSRYRIVWYLPYRTATWTSCAPSSPRAPTTPRALRPRAS